MHGQYPQCTVNICNAPSTEPRFWGAVRVVDSLPTGKQVLGLAEGSCGKVWSSSNWWEYVKLTGSGLRRGGGRGGEEGEGRADCSEDVRDYEKQGIVCCLISSAGTSAPLRRPRLPGGLI